MAKKPRNHATALMMGDGPTLGELPVLEEDQLVILERNFPPACIGRHETVEDHLRYAGKVELVQSLRLRAEQQEDTDDYVHEIPEG